MASDSTDAALPAEPAPDAGLLPNADAAPAAGSEAEPTPSPRFSGAVPGRARRARPPRERGLVGGGWIAWPVLACLATSLAVTWQIGQRIEAEWLPFVVALYGCAAFFGWGYSMAWQGRHVIRHLLALGLTTSVLAFVAWFLAQEAPARETFLAGQRVPRAPEPGLFFAVALLGVACVLLLTHGLVLGFGSRVVERRRDGNAKAGSGGASAEP